MKSASSLNPLRKIVNKSINATNFFLLHILKCSHFFLPDFAEIFLQKVHPDLPIKLSTFAFYFRHILIIMSSSQLKAIKQSNNLDGLLIADDKGFEIHNSGFQQAHHLHSLKQLSNFFFPGKAGTVVGIETTDFTVIIRDTEDGKMVATKQAKKESQ